MFGYFHIFTSSYSNLPDMQDRPTQFRQLFAPTTALHCPIRVSFTTGGSHLASWFRSS